MPEKKPEGKLVSMQGFKDKKKAKRREQILNELADEAYKLFGLSRGDEGTQHDE